MMRSTDDVQYKELGILEVNDVIDDEMKKTFTLSRR